MKKSEALNILGLKDGATDDEIKKVHRKLIIENHPDKFGQDAVARDKAEEKTKRINEARDVLLSRKWDPEYSTAGTPYGAPFTYNPYAGYPPTGSRPGSNAQDPFGGAWPFPEGTFVWTSWDSAGNTYTSHGAANQGGGTNPFGGSTPGQNPFDGARGQSPFGGNTAPFDFSSFFTATLTPEQRLQQTKDALKTELKLIGLKFLVLALCVLLSMPALGLYLYTIASIGLGIWKRLSFLSFIFVGPLVVLALIFAPVADPSIGLFGLLVFACAVAFDISNIIRYSKKIVELDKLVKK